MNWRMFVTPPQRWPVARAMGLALLCTATLATRVYTGFDGVRIKVQQAPRAFNGGSLSVIMPESTRWGRIESPVVLIARLQNPSHDTARINASLKGERLAFSLPPEDERRFDLVVPNEVTIRAGDVLTFDVDSTAAVAKGCCTLDYLEVANLHGTSHSVPSFIVVPPGSHNHTAPAWIVVLFATIAIAGLLLRGIDWTLDPVTRRAQRLLAVAAAGLFAASLASTTVSYMLVLSWKSFVIGAMALTWPGIVRMWRDAQRIAARHVPAASWWLSATLVATLVTLFYGLFARTYLTSFDGNYSGFLRIGQPFADKSPFLKARPDLKAQLTIIDGPGYDAQYAYYITFDPFLRAFKDEPARYRQIVDLPPYRYGRIGFSLLTKLFSLDDPALYPRTMVWLIVVASFVGAWWLAAIAQQFGLSAAWALLYVLIPGFLQSLRMALPEGIAAAGLIGGYWLFLRGRLGLAAIALAASLLVRETGALLVIALAVWTAFFLHNRRGGLVIGSALVPLAFWRIYIAWRLFADVGWHGFFYPQIAGIPFGGILDVWRGIHAGRISADTPDQMIAGIWFPLLLIAALLIASYLVWKRPGPLTAAAVGYALLAVSTAYIPVWVYVGNAERVSYEVFLLLIVAFVSLDRTLPHARVLLGGFMLCTMLYQWLASLEAGTLRYTVLSSLT